jgi:hypothetical protein
MYAAIGRRRSDDTDVRKSTKRGRPVEVGAEGAGASVTFRIPDELLWRLDYWAKKDGVSRSEAARAALERGLGPKTKKRSGKPSAPGSLKD